MIHTSTQLLRDSKQFNKLCRRLNGDFGCKEAFGCSISCPLWIAKEVEFLCNEKRMTLGEAYRATIRQFDCDKEKRREIIAGAINKNREYPDGGK